MRIKLIAVGSKMPRWVEDGWHEYAKRLPSELPLELHEISLNTRGKNADVARLIRQEGEAMLAKVQPGERIVTLEVTGRPWSTEQLAGELERWRLDARSVNLMVGGPEGLEDLTAAPRPTSAMFLSNRLRRLRRPSTLDFLV